MGWEKLKIKLNTAQLGSTQLRIYKVKLLLKYWVLITIHGIHIIQLYSYSINDVEF